MSTRENIERLEFTNLGFDYAGHGPVFENVNFVMPEAKSLWLRTHGGRGRSTLLKIFAGLVQPQRGSYLINGRDVAAMTFAEFLKYRLNMGYGFDLHGLLSNKSLFENLLFPLEFHQMLPHVEAAERAQDIIDRFELSASQDLRPFAVSGSERKLTCVLRAFVHRPQIVFLDDPFVGLKQKMSEELIRFVGEALREHGLKQIVFAAESPEWAERFHSEQIWIGNRTIMVGRAA